MEQEIEILNEEDVFLDEEGSEEVGELSGHLEADVDAPTEGKDAVRYVRVKRETYTYWRGVRSCRRRAKRNVDNAFDRWIDEIKAEFSGHRFREASYTARWWYRNGRSRWSRRRYCSGRAILQCEAIFEV